MIFLPVLVLLVLVDHDAVSIEFLQPGLEPDAVGIEKEGLEVKVLQVVPVLLEIVLEYAALCLVLVPRVGLQLGFGALLDQELEVVEVGQALFIRGRFKADNLLIRLNQVGVFQEVVRVERVVANMQERFSLFVHLVEQRDALKLGVSLTRD